MDAVVVDAGSKLLKAGFAAPDQDPALVIPTKMEQVVEDGDMVNSAMFEEVKVDPVVRGFIREWDAMEDLLHHVLYSQLAWEAGNEGNILFTEPLSTPKSVREQLVQLMFETFNISGFYASEQAVLSLYAVGRISGCTVDIGHGKIDIAPVCEGFVQHIASKRFEIGGIDLTELLSRELQKSNPLVKIDISTVERLKEQYACCAADQFAYEYMHKSTPEKHVLPDGQVIIIEKERYVVGEALFQPSILGLEGKSKESHRPSLLPFLFFFCPYLTFLHLPVSFSSCRLCTPSLFIGLFLWGFFAEKRAGEERSRIRSRGSSRLKIIYCCFPVSISFFLFFFIRLLPFAFWLFSPYIFYRMQGQRGVMELDQGSNSGNSAIDPQVYWGNTEPGMAFVNTVTTSPERESFRGWNFSDPESTGYRGNPIDLEQPKRNCEWNSTPVSNSNTSSRSHGSFEPQNVVQLENVEVEIDGNNSNNNRTPNLDFFRLHQNSEYNPNIDFNNTNSQASESDTQHLFNSFRSDEHIIQPVVDSRNSWSASASENRFHLPENTDGRLQDSLVGQRVTGKRKIHEGPSEQPLTSGSLKHLLKGESSGQGFFTGNSNRTSGGLELNILNQSGNPTVKGTSPGFDGDTRAGMENARRNDCRRLNPSRDQDIMPNTGFWTPSSSHMHPNSWPQIQPSSYNGSYVQPHEVRPPAPVLLQPTQSQSTVPKNSAMPQNSNHVSWNGSLNSPSISRERYPLRRVVRTLPLPLPLIDARFQHQDPTDWNLFTGNVSSSLSLSSDAVGPPIQIRPSDIARRTVASSGSDSGAQSSDVGVLNPIQSSAAPEIAPTLATGSRRQHRILLRSAFLMERQTELFGVPFPHRIATMRDGRGRMMSEQIRNALDGIRRGDNLRGFESMIFGGVELQDRHRDMRLDVDNMSYEELLALEDRIGNVSTGLSEEAIMKHLKLQKYKSSSQDVEIEPCCICQEEYIEGDDLGVLECGHDFHSDCIKKWISHKNLCPVCKTTGLVI